MVGPVAPAATGNGLASGLSTLSSLQAQARHPPLRVRRIRWGPGCSACRVLYYLALLGTRDRSSYRSLPFDLAGTLGFQQHGDILTEGADRFQFRWRPALALLLGKRLVIRLFERYVFYQPRASVVPTSGHGTLTAGVLLNSSRSNPKSRAAFPAQIAAVSSSGTSWKSFARCPGVCGKVPST
jgi:hypothetical protein